MALTAAQQSFNKEELQTLLLEKEAALVYLNKMDYVDTYKTEIRKKNTPDQYTAKVIDEASPLRLFLETLGVSTSAKNEIISKIKKAGTEVENDTVLINALISIK
jgi:hypothetical protein